MQVEKGVGTGWVLERSCYRREDVGVKDVGVKNSGRGRLHKLQFSPGPAHPEGYANVMGQPKFSTRHARTGFSKLVLLMHPMRIVSCLRR